MIDPAVLDAMLEAGCTAEQIVAAVKADAILQQQRLDHKRAKDAERQRKSRANRKQSESVTVTPRDTADADHHHISDANSLKDNDVTVTLCDSADKNTFDKKAPHTPQKIKSKNPPIVPPFEGKLLDVWNANAGPGGLTRALPLNRDRKAKLARRLGEFGEDQLIEAARRLGSSPFHRGENDRGWRADIGWFLKSAENVTKSLEIEPPRTRDFSPPANDFLAHKLEQRRQAGASR